jgi:glucan biosynthesis protein C
MDRQGFAMDTQQRLHSLDAVRAFALLLGIVLHAAASFVPPEFGIPWLISDRSSGILPALLMFVIHIFRMSLFFFVAGFFAHLVYHRKGAVAFARDRLTRIALPLVFFWCLLTPIHRYLWWWGARRLGNDYPLTLWPSAAQWANGELPMTHLWFLYYLLLFYVFIVGPRHLLINRIDRQERVRRNVDRWFRRLLDTRWLPLVLAVPLAIAAWFAVEWNPAMGMPFPPNSVIPDPVMLVGYGVAFLAGWVCNRDMSLLLLLTERRLAFRWIFAISFVVSGISGAVLMLYPTVAPTAFRVLAAFAVTTEMWCIIFAIMGFALKKFSRPSVRVRYVSDASYWMYLAHIPVVGLLQIWFADLPLHWSIKFPLLIGVAFAALLITYRYGVRYTAIGMVLNGRRDKPELRPESVSVSQS